jgi:ketosteroid isomerase-like protein
MSVNEIQALTQKFADAFDQRDLQPVMEMLSEDVEVFDHVPYRFDGKPLFAKYLHEAVAGLVSASFGFRQPSCRVYGDTVYVFSVGLYILAEVSQLVGSATREAAPDGHRG